MEKPLNGLSEGGVYIPNMETSMILPVGSPYERLVFIIILSKAVPFP
jgi:hypothetical protein